MEFSFSIYVFDKKVDLFNKKLLHSLIDYV